MQEGYCETFQELLETTDWSRYGHKSGNPKCADCMMHCGYEPTAVAETFTSWKAFVRMARLTLFGPPRRPEPASNLPGTDRPVAVGGRGIGRNPVAKGAVAGVEPVKAAAKLPPIGKGELRRQFSLWSGVSVPPLAAGA